MSDLVTPLGFVLPDVMGDDDQWGDLTNENWQLADALLNRAPIVTADTPPTFRAGQLWFDSAGGQLYVGYDDGNSQQWVAASNNFQGITALTYVGGWNAATNTPTMASGALVNGVVAPSGTFYVVTQSGTTAAIDGNTSWAAGDYIVSTGAVWQRVAASTAPLTWTATGGTVPRAAPDRSGQVIDIRDLGAACDGVTDDTAAWTLAFAKPTGTVIRIPQNCVTIVGDGNFRAPGRAVSIVGDGRGSVIRLKAGTAMVNTGLFTWPGLGTQRNLRLENFTFDFNNCPAPAALVTLFGVLQYTGVFVRNVAIINGAGNLYMFGPNNCSDVVVDGCYFHLTAGISTAQSKGVVISGSLGMSTNVRVTNNVFVNTNSNFTNTNQLLFAYNDVSGWGVGAGVATDPNNSQVTIIGNKCHDSVAATDMYGINPNGIESWTQNTTIIGNECWNCYGGGIAVGGLNSLVAGNTCWNNNVGALPFGSGIGVCKAAPGDASGSVILGNYCYDTAGRQSYGFNVVNSGIVNITLDGNVFSGSTGAVRLSNATFLSTVDYTPRNGIIYTATYTSLQAAHDALPANGGELILPGNTTITINTQLNITKPNVKIRGQGPSTVILRGATLNNICVNITGDYCTISDLTIDGNTANTVNSFVELRLGGQSCLAERLVVKNSRARHVTLNGAYCTLRRSRIIGLNDLSGTNQAYGVWAIGGVTVHIKDNVISDCGIDGIGADGNYTQITGNHVFNCHSYTAVGGGQIAVYNSATNFGIVIANNTVDAGAAAVSHGIECDAVSCVIQGNVVRNQKWYGIALDAHASNVNVNGNAVTNSNQGTTTNGAAVFVAAGVSRFMVNGNTLSDLQGTPTQRYGVWVNTGASDHYQIRGNLITGNVSGQVNDLGTGVNKDIGNNLA